MADFDKIKINGVAYNVKDTATAQAVDQVESDLNETNSTVQQQGQQITQQGQQITQQGQAIAQQGQQITQLGQQIQQETTDREEAITELENKIASIAIPNSRMFLALFHNQTPQGDNNAVPRFYITSDGDHYMRIVSKTNDGVWPSMPDARDGCIRYINGTFYVACTSSKSGGQFGIYYSKDFITWNFVGINASLPSGDIWAPDIDEFSSNNRQLGIFVTSNQNLYYVIVRLNDGIPQPNASATSLNVSGYIDPCATYLSFRDKTTQELRKIQCILLKNESTKRLEVFSYSTTAPTKLDAYTPGDNWPSGIEGFFTIQFGGITKIMADYYYSATEAQHDTQFIINGFTAGVGTGADNFSVVQPVNFDDSMGYNIQGCRHGSAIEITQEIAAILNNACVLYNGAATNHPRKDPVNAVDLTNPQNGFTIVPYHCYRITGTSATIPQPLNPFGLKEFDLIIASDSMALTCTSTPEGSKTYQIDNKAGSTVHFVQSKGTLFSPSGV